MDGTDVIEQTNPSTADEAVAEFAPAEVVASSVEAIGEVSEPTSGVDAAVASDDAELDAASLMEQFLNDP
ncbi:MAG: hypothetical protein KY456_03365, partial [Chloroflexi bacterium]|nr:hypothetical protein [Chloroflexota bacterium]